MAERVVLAARIVTEAAPKRVLLIGEPDPDVAAALQATGAEVTRVDAGSVPTAGRYDLVLWYHHARPRVDEDARRRLMETVSTLADDVLLLDADPRAPGADWIERFADKRFFVDIDLAARAACLRFRRARRDAGTDDEAGRLRDLANELYRSLEDRDHAIAQLRVRAAAMEANVGWKLIERLSPLEKRLVRHPLTRQPFLVARRAIEVLVEEGPVETVRKIRHKLALALHGRAFLVRPHVLPPADVDLQYERWLAQHPTSEADLARMATAARGLRLQPTFSLLAISDPMDPAAVTKLVETMRAQVYERWQLCVGARLGNQTTSEDPRVTIAAPVPGESTAAAALRVAHGEFVGVLDVRDALAPAALVELVRCVNDNPDADIVYSDEDAVEADGRRVRPFFKPDWSPDLLRSTNYMARLAVVRRSLVEEVGGFRADAAGAEAYDLLLRAAARAKKIAHVPRVLYHRRLDATSVVTTAATEKVAAAERLVLLEDLRRRGVEGEVHTLPGDPHAVPHHAVRYRLRGEPHVSIVIATRDKARFLAQCVRSIEEKSTYGRYEIIVVDNDSREPETLAYLAECGRKHRVCAAPGKFNFSAINNLGARQASGDQLLFLNNDVEVITPDWLQAMLEHAQRADVGAVGAKLLYADGRIQHAGVVVGLNGAAGNVFRLAPAEDEHGPRLCDVVRNCSAVTAACMLVPRGIFEELGGFDEQLPVAFQDVDLCLRIRDRGRLVIYTPFARLYHYEGASRGRRHPTRDERFFQDRWAKVLERGDPYYNPNLSHVRDDWSLRLEP